MIPNLMINQKQVQIFNISARPISTLVIMLNSPSGIEIKPNRIVLGEMQTSASFQIRAIAAGQYFLSYELSGSAAVDFETPESTSVLVPASRSAGHVNRYFRLLRERIGIVRESCCQPEHFTYSECPTSSTPITFRSTCSWMSDNTRHETRGVVFAEHEGVSLPISINGISINYANPGSISSQIFDEPISSCSPCSQSQSEVFGTTLSSLTCYYYKFNSGDVEDMLRSNSLVDTFLDRLSDQFPPWFGVSVLSSTSSSIQEFDFLASVVKQDAVSMIRGCENVAARDEGLYIAVRYQQSFELSVGADTLRHVHSSAEQDSNPVCMAVNLCEGIESPISVGLPESIQTMIRQLSFMASYNQELCH